VHPDLQDLAQATGGTGSDSLEMARFGHEHKGFHRRRGGVRFMGETAKILNPRKRVLMPDLAAECSLDLATPDRRVLEVLRRAPRPGRGRLREHQRRGEGARRLDGHLVHRREDRGHLHAQGKKILWAPDKHLGDYVQRVTGADMLMWNAAASCTTSSRRSSSRS
jgi:quinolinate synthase